MTARRPEPSSIPADEGTVHAVASPRAVAFDGTVAMVGGGQMALALAAGFVRRGCVAGSGIRVHDPSQEATQRFLVAVPGAVAAESHAEAIADARLVVLAVKPQHAERACGQIAERLPAEATVVSVVAGVTIEQLSRWLGSHRIVRVMPNTPCLIGRGVLAVAAASQVDAEVLTEIETLLTTVGQVHRLPEGLLDAVTGLSGSGPGFLAVVVEALADGGVLAGLPRPLALEMAVQTMAGTAALLAATGEHPAALKDRVASPAGTTMAGLAELERHGVRAALIDAVTAAARRAADLGGASDRRA